MPTYEYKCRDCGHGLEVHQSFDDSALTECPSCGGDLRKKLGTPGIAFKGSGFYRNDSRAGSTTSSSGSSSESSSGSSDSSTGDKESSTPSDSSSSTASTS